jgi:SIR2-like domain
VPDPSLEAHYRTVVKAIFDGRVVPLLGAGVNLCGRPAETSWSRGEYLPSGAELAQYLAKEFDYPQEEDQDLVKVSQYAAVMTGSGPLYEKLHDLFDADYPPTPLHTFLASVPAVMRNLGQEPKYQLIVTTNYDDALERAFSAAEEPFDLVTYIAEGEHRGKFLHWPPGEEARVIEKPNEYADLSLADRTVVLKIHGVVDRLSADWAWDSFVITEDHYIDYLTRTDISNVIPVTLAAKLRKSHFLFLGYSLRDWNLRVILYRIWGEQKLSYKSWAVHLNPGVVDTEAWGQRGVDVLDSPLEEYVQELAGRLAQPAEVAS